MVTKLKTGNGHTTEEEHTTNTDNKEESSTARY